MKVVSLSVLVSLVGLSALAQAEEAPPPPPPASAPYSLPWQLRPATAATVVRSDTTAALYSGADGHGGSTIATTLLGSYKVTKSFAPLVRVAVVGNSPPGADGAVSFVNPVVGGTYLFNLRADLRLALFLGLTIPVGMGGGDSPDPAVAATTKSGVLARSAMDNAMFAVNDFTVFPGADLAYVRGGFTAQAEVTLLQLTRVRGAAAQPDASKTNLTMGAHIGYYVIPELSLGAELRYQRWLSTPAAVDANPATRDTLTFAVGPRLNLKMSPTIWFRPGIAYARGLDAPMSAQDYNIVQLDLPLSF